MEPSSESDETSEYIFEISDSKIRISVISASFNFSDKVILIHLKELNLYFDALFDNFSFKIPKWVQYSRAQLMRKRKIFNLKRN